MKAVLITRWCFFDILSTRSGKEWLRNNDSLIDNLHVQFLSNMDCRSSHRRSFIEKQVLIIFVKLTGKSFCRSHFSNRVARSNLLYVFLKISQNLQDNTCVRASFLVKLQASACNFTKKETLAQVLSCKFCEFFKNTFFTENLLENALSLYRKRSLAITCYSSFG